MEFNQCHKSDKTPSIVYADLKNLIKKSNLENKDNLEKSSATKVGEHIPYGYSMSVIWTFDDIENNHDVRGIRNILNVCL